MGAVAFASRKLSRSYYVRLPKDGQGYVSTLVAVDLV
jgi:hypothetical protein